MLRSRAPFLGVGRRLLRSALFAAVALPALLFLTGCYRFGDESTWLRVQNLGGEAASFSIQQFDDEGQPAAEHLCPSRLCPALAPGAGTTVRLESLSGFPEELLGSAVVASDQPLALLMGIDVARSEGRYQSAGDTLPIAASGGRLYLPLMMRGAGPDGDWHGRFAVQNVSTSVVACVTLTYLTGDAAPLYYDPYEPARPPAVREPGCPNGGMPLQPGASLFRDATTIPPPLPYAGAVRIDAHTNAQGRPASSQRLVATAGIWNEHSMHFGTYRALREAELGFTVLLPLVERQAAGFWNTQLWIENRDPNVPATVNLRIEGWDYGQTPPQPVSRQSTFRVRTSRLCDQDDPQVSCLVPGDELPLGFSGRATLISSQPIGVVVARGMAAQDWYDTYRGIASQQAATKVYLPLVAKSGQSSERTGTSSTIRIQVADGGDARVTVRYRGEALGEGQVTHQVLVAGAASVVQDWIGALPDGFVGSAVLESDRPIVAVVAALTGQFPGDPLLMYVGVPGS